MNANVVVPDTMQVAVIDGWGGVESLAVRSVPVPAPAADEVLIRVEVAGVGSWDREERAGHYAAYLGTTTFPYVLGWDGAGVIAAVGASVTNLTAGDRVYAAVWPKPSGGGFYAEYAVVKAADVVPLPATLPIEQAGVMGWDALTALAGVDDVLALKPGESVLIFGASGGVGHLAVQLAKRLGARVFAVASGEDGVSLVKRLGADAAVDGRKEDVVAAARAFAPGGLDAALATAGGEAADRALATVREGGRIAFPNGVVPKPTERPGVTLRNYDAIRGPEAVAKLHRLMSAGPFEVHVAQTFTLDTIADAHRALEKHYLGKLAMRPRTTG